VRRKSPGEPAHHNEYLPPPGFRFTDANRTVIEAALLIFAPTTYSAHALTDGTHLASMAAV
jgi:hypothetical protein